MKKLFLILSITMIAVTVLAVPAKPGLWKVVKLADGTEVRAELKGDEFCNYYQTSDGRRLVKNLKTGFYEAADMDAMARRAVIKRGLPARLAPGRAQRSNVSYTGLKKGLIILVQFADVKFKDANTPELYNRIINERGFSNDMGFRGSVKDYFLDQSYGQMEFDFDIVGPVTMPEGYAYYGHNTEDNNSANIGEMVIEACRAADDVVDFSKYDWDGDGEVEQVFFIFAGHGEASYPKDPDTIWPHKWSVRSATYPDVVELRLDNVLIDVYACGSELGSTEDIDGIGTICHEFSHCLGLPDMYDTQKDGEYGTSSWDIMCAGNYNGNSFCPAGYTSYERMAIGWVQPVELKTDCTVTDMKNLEESGEAYIIYNDGNSNEYYLLENRQKTGWDSELPGSGLIIIHVDYNKRAWEYNVVNSIVGQSMYGLGSGHQRCALVPADNSTGESASDKANDAWPYAYNNSLTNNSSPAAVLFNPNSDGSLFLNKSVRDITRNGNMISFTFENENDASSDYDLPQSYIFYESFDKCDGTGGNDGRFNATTTGAVVYDNAGWASPSSRKADRCAVYGSATLAGQATTPEIDINGEYTLLFKAAPYTGDGTTLTLEAVSGDVTFDKSTFVMKENSWSAFRTKITGTGPAKLRFKGVKRFYLDKVCVTSDTSNGVAGVTVDGNGVKDGRIYSIDGRYVGRDFDALKKGIYIIGGKKVVK